MAEAVHPPATSDQARPKFHFRPATLSDLPGLINLIDVSIRQLSIGHYTPSQIDGSIGFLFAPDTLLIEDGTYFIIYPSAEPETIVASGGWSFRKTLYGGDRAPGKRISYPTFPPPILSYFSLTSTTGHPSPPLNLNLTSQTNPSGRLPATRDPAVDRASIRAIFTHPDWSRRGLGGKMLTYCEEAARAGGFERLELGSTLTGVRLYEKSGYVRSGVEDVVKLGNGDELRVVHMVKDLEGVGT
jgi:hypothetical protein